jgi:hypothetical protein
MDSLEPARRAVVYQRLIRNYQALPAQADPEPRWTWLMAAHVVGQARFSLHWDSHVRMLKLAVSLRDGREAAGQLMRLALVPLGHALQRLPAGNVGRATVNAFRPMRPPEPVRQAIALALEGAPQPPG